METIDKVILGIVFSLLVFLVFFISGIQKNVGLCEGRGGAYVDGQCLKIETISLESP
jgi:hypothetical protein